MVLKHLDEIIDLLMNGGVRNNPCRFNILCDEKVIMDLCRHAREAFMQEEMMLKVEVPLVICGDIHGQFEDLLEIFSVAGTPAEETFLFLGDYVDRGRQSLECICLLFALKLKHRNSLYLLRGNHEEAGMNEMYGFFDECKRRYSVRLWKAFLGAFNCMPIAALVSGKIFCCHGGLSPSLRSFDQIRTLKRPCPIPEYGLMCDLLWSDPNPEKCSSGWEPNVDRGISYTFGRDIVRQFLKDFHVDLVCRAHEVVQDGYEFFADQGLVTIFSAPLYTQQFDNDGAIMKIDSNLMCRFFIFKPSCVEPLFTL